MIKNKFFYDLPIKKEIIDILFDRILHEYHSHKVGYYHLLDEDTVEIKRYARTLSWVKRVVVVGIGGSALGTKAIHQLLYATKTNLKKISFLESVGPNAIKSIINKINFEETLFLIVSKSGTTIETISNFKYIIYKFGVDFQKDKKHFCIITDEDSKLDNFAKKYNLKTFHIPQNVGGRFSVLSPVGLVPLAVLGYDIDEFLRGAKLLRERFFECKYDNLIKKAIFYGANAKRFPINVLFSYSSTFKAFNEWYMQLWGESLGKIDRQGKRVGLTPIGLIGSIDQHSFLQLLTQGPLDKTVTFIKVDDFNNDIRIPDIKLDFLEDTDFVNGYTFNYLINAQCDATMKSVIKNGINVDLIELYNFSEESIGFLIFYFELLTSLTAFVLNINAYDQPGVEEGKEILKGKFDNSDFGVKR